jgi:hypothetical protein
VTYRKYKNAQQLEREKYLRDCKFTNFDHSETSSDCSFDEDPRAIIMKSQDTKYNIRIEKLFPKNLRRIRFHEITENKELAREEYIANVLSDPDKYSARKGLRELFILEQKNKEKNEKKKISKITKATHHNFPWLAILTPAETLLPDNEREQIIREKYYSIINSEISPDELVNSTETIKFIQWYEGVRNKTITPAKFDPAQFAIETKGQIAKLRMVDPRKKTKGAKNSKVEIGVIKSSDESESS